MKLNLFCISVLIFFLCSCGGSRKAAMNRDKTNYPAVSTEKELNIEEAAEKPIVEVEEKLVPIKEVPPEPYQYFVIIGSFRNPNNAMNFQKQIEKDGFSSELLKNEAGLFRVSVMASNDILAARKEISRIRKQHPNYSDTWLLIHLF
jgi:cell division protein FtsN